MAYKEILDVYHAWNRGEYKVDSSSNIPRTLPDSYVFDENLSVKENRDLINKHNADVAAQKAAVKKAQEDVIHRLRDDVVACIVEWGLSVEQANIIESHAWVEKHHSIADYIFFADELAELVVKVNKAGE